MKVTRVNVLDGGRGWFDEAPIVSLHGGGGTGAHCIAHVDRGEVVAVQVLDGGVNYTDAPEVRFSGGGRAVGTSPVAQADIARGGTAFADQPVPKPENPAKDPKSTTPVRADSKALEDDRKPFQPPKTKATPDEEPGRQHTESDPRQDEGKTDKLRSQFNPGGAPTPDEEKKGGQSDQPERDPSPAPSQPQQPAPPPPQQPQPAPRHTPTPIKPPQPKPAQPQQRPNPSGG